LGVDKKESIQERVVGEESEALVPFIGWWRTGAVGRGGEWLVAMGIKTSSYCIGFAKGNRGVVRLNGGEGEGQRGG
jgi:hypothetical protein